MSRNMNRRALALAAVTMVSVAATAGAQSPGATTQPIDESGAKPAITNSAGYQYPKVDAQGRVISRFVAPTAKAVMIDLVGKKYPLTNDGNGVWTGITDPIPVGFHYYAMNIDGVRMPDPGSRTFFGSSGWMSGIDIPDPTGDFYLPRPDVKRGEVRITPYFSKIDNKVRNAWIYTPPGYDTSGERYPVLYLQHGAGEDETGWTMQGYTNTIMDNLIADGKAKPMIIVMENGGGSALFANAQNAPNRGGGGGAPGGLMGAPGGMGGGAASRPAGGPPAMGGPGGGAASRPAGMGGPGGGQRAGGGGGRPGMMGGNFEQILLTEVIPMVDAKFRTIADKDHRAMAGLSMGGGQTMSIGAMHPEVFSALGVFSAPPRVAEAKTAYNGLFADPAEFAKKFHPLYISIGTTENVQGARDAHKALEDAGIKHVYFESEGTAHEWQTWRRSLFGFAPLLFQNN